MCPLKKGIKQLSVLYLRSSNSAFFFIQRRTLKIYEALFQKRGQKKRKGLNLQIFWVQVRVTPSLKCRTRAKALFFFKKRREQKKNKKKKGFLKGCTFFFYGRRAGG